MSDRLPPDREMPPTSADPLRRLAKTTRFLSVIGAALALTALVFATYKIRDIDRRIVKAQNDLNNVSAAVNSKQQELAETESKLKQANAELNFAQMTYQKIAKNLAPGVAQQAIQQTAAADPNAANLPPLVYIHIAREDQRIKATQIQSELRRAGYTAPGIEYVGAKAPNHSQLRYFVRTDEGPAMEKILMIIRSVGVDINGQYIRIAAQSPRALRPNQFEVWLGLDYTP